MLHLSMTLRSVRQAEADWSKLDLDKYPLMAKAM